MDLRRTLRVTLCLAAVTCAVGCGDGQEGTGGAKPGSPQAEELQPMPRTGHVVEWGTPGVPCQMKVGATVPVSVIVKNTGDQVWRDVASSGAGRGAVRLGARWWAATPGQTPVIEYTAHRGDLHGPVAPGETAMLTVPVAAPPTPGSYLLQLDLVEELVVWFQDMGATKLMVPVTVT